MDATATCRRGGVFICQIFLKFFQLNHIILLFPFVLLNWSSISSTMVRLWKLESISCLLMINRTVFWKALDTEEDSTGFRAEIWLKYVFGPKIEILVIKLPKLSLIILILKFRWAFETFLSWAIWLSKNGYSGIWLTVFEWDSCFHMNILHAQNLIS